MRKLKDIAWDKTTYSTKWAAKNPYRIDGPITYILINNGREASVFTRDFWHLRLYSYHWHSSSTKAGYDYPITNLPDFSGYYVRLGMHQLIMGRKDGVVIDHIDGNHYNNTGWNLRYGTIRQNNSNRHKKQVED